MIYENPELRVNFSYYHAWRINASVKHKKDTNQAFMMHNHCMNHVAEHVKCFEKNLPFYTYAYETKIMVQGFSSVCILTILIAYKSFYVMLLFI